MLESHARQTQQQWNEQYIKTEETKQKCRLGTASNKITGRLQLVCGRPTLALSSALLPWLFDRPDKYIAGCRERKAAKQQQSIQVQRFC